MRSVEMWLAQNPITQWQQTHGHDDARLLRLCNKLRVSEHVTDMRPMTFQCIASLKKGEQRFRHKSETWRVEPQDFWMLEKITGMTLREYLQWLSDAPDVDNPMEDCVEFWEYGNPSVVLRSIMHVSQKQLTKKAALSLSDVTRIEKGRCNSIAHLVRVAHCFSVDKVDFVAAYVRWLMDRPRTMCDISGVMLLDPDLAGYEEVTQDMKTWRQRQGDLRKTPRWFKGQLRKPRKA